MINNLICNLQHSRQHQLKLLSLKTNNGFVRASASPAMLRARLPCADQIAFSLDDAPALHDDGVTEDPLQPPVSCDGVLRALLHRLLECCS